MTSSRAPTLFALRKATRTGTSTLVLARPGVVGELGMCGRSLYGQRAAESAEPRVGAEGNASWQSSHRTQGRERVSQALERVRQVARQRKKEKFTALLHHVGVDLLGMAFFALKRDAAPGV